MAQEGRVSRAVMVSATPLPQAAGSMLHWDGRSGVCRDLGPPTCSAPGQWSSFQAQGPPATGDGTRPYWTTGAIGLVPSLFPQAIEWEQEAARVTFSLDPVLLTEIGREGTPRATAELVWVHCQETAESYTSVVHPVLLIHAPDESWAVERVIIVRSFAEGPVRRLHCHSPMRSQV
jgi:hypothetical protein